MKKKLHTKGCIEGNRCIECLDVERYTNLVKGGMSPEEAQKLTAQAIKNRLKLAQNMESGKWYHGDNIECPKDEPCEICTR